MYLVHLDVIYHDAAIICLEQAAYSAQGQESVSYVERMRDKQ